MSKALYSAYVLSTPSRERLLGIFPPKYSKLIAHHITVQFGNVTAESIPVKAEVNVIGYADSGDGIEALVVSVDGSSARPDGSLYHITWSLQGDYKPVDSNYIIKKHGFLNLDIPITIDTIPQVVMTK